jgi:hypothetical protein
MQALKPVVRGRSTCSSWGRRSFCAKPMDFSRILPNRKAQAPHGSTTIMTQEPTRRPAHPGTPGSPLDPTITRTPTPGPACLRRGLMPAPHLEQQVGSAHMCQVTSPAPPCPDLESMRSPSGNWKSRTGKASAVKDRSSENSSVRVLLHDDEMNGYST